jgi:hypothetical protein
LTKTPKSHKKLAFYAGALRKMLYKSPSNKRKILTATLLLTLLISALTATLLINNATASVPTELDTRELRVSVMSPISDKAYGATEIPLQFYAAVRAPWRRAGSYTYEYHGNYEPLAVRYWLDGKLMGEYSGEDLSKAYSVVLTGLSDGEHSVRVWMTVFAIFMGEPSGYSNTVYFTVDTSAPSISVITSQETFETSGSSADVPLNFTVNKSVSWIGYSLDGKNVVTVTDDVASTEWFGRDNYQLVLRGLNASTHTLTVYAEDTAGNRGESKLYTFTITQETPPQTKQTEPSSTTTTAAASAIIASATAIALGLAAYSLKRKRKNNKK